MFVGGVRERGNRGDMANAGSIADRIPLRPDMMKVPSTLVDTPFIAKEPHRCCLGSRAYAEAQRQDEVEKMEEDEVCKTTEPHAPGKAEISLPSRLCTFPTTLRDRTSRAIIAIVLIASYIPCSCSYC